MINWKKKKTPDDKKNRESWYGAGTQKHLHRDFFQGFLLLICLLLCLTGHTTLLPQPRLVFWFLYTRHMSLANATKRTVTVGVSGWKIPSLTKWGDLCSGSPAYWVRFNGVFRQKIKRHSYPIFLPPISQQFSGISGVPRARWSAGGASTRGLHDL